jgi:hypothetical protein
LRAGPGRGRLARPWRPIEPGRLVRPGHRQVGQRAGLDHVDGDRAQLAVQLLAGHPQQREGLVVGDLASRHQHAERHADGPAALQRGLQMGGLVLRLVQRDQVGGQGGEDGGRVDSIGVEGPRLVGVQVQRRRPLAGQPEGQHAADRCLRRGRPGELRPARLVLDVEEEVVGGVRGRGQARPLVEPVLQLVHLAGHLVRHGHAVALRTPQRRDAGPGAALDMLDRKFHDPAQRRLVVTGAAQLGTESRELLRQLQHLRGIHCLPPDVGRRAVSATRASCTMTARFGHLPDEVACRPVLGGAGG